MSKKDYVMTRRETKIISISLLIFFIGFFLGVSFTDSNLDELQIEIENNLLDLKSFSDLILFQEALGGDICSDFEPRYLLNKISDSAIRLDELEQSGAIDNSYYELLKEKHNINQVLFYTYYKSYYDSCENSTDIILFFFNSSDNREGVILGNMLDSVREQRDVIVLPMDYGYFESLDYFYEFHGGFDIPFLVVNYNATLQQISLAEEIISALDNS